MRETLEVYFPGGKKVDIKVGNFIVQTDQSAKSGGNATAPEPFDLFLASIAGCAGIYALSFCQSRSLETEGLGLSMAWERGDKQHRGARVQLRLTLPQAFPEKYRPGIIKAMELCSVKRYLQDPPEFFIDVA